MNGTDHTGGAGRPGSAEPGHPSAPSPERLARERDRWERAGDRLWATAMADPDTYRRLAGAVGAVVDGLRAADDLGALAALAEAAERDPRGDGPVAEAANVVGIATVVGAACAVRAVEIDARACGAARSGAIADARRAGRAWAVLDAGPMRWVDMHVSTGLALVATIDPYSDRGPYGLEEVVLDTTSGAPLADHADGRERFLDKDTWRRARARRRREIEDVYGRDGDDGGG